MGLLFIVIVTKIILSRSQWAHKLWSPPGVGTCREQLISFDQFPVSAVQGSCRGVDGSP